MTKFLVLSIFLAGITPSSYALESVVNEDNLQMDGGGGYTSGSTGSTSGGSSDSISQNDNNKPCRPKSLPGVDDFRVDNRTGDNQDYVPQAPETVTQDNSLPECEDETPPPAGTFVDLKSGESCDAYRDPNATSGAQSAYILQNARCPINMGCFPSEMDDILTPVGITLTNPQQDTIDEVMTKLEDVSDLEIGQTCSLANLNAMFVIPDVLTKIKTVYPSSALKKQDLLCSSFKCGTNNKCQANYACRCARHDEEAPNQNACCDGFVFDPQNKVCKDYTNLFEMAQFMPPIPPTLANGCNIEFQKDNPSREFYILSTLIHRGFDILTSFRYDGGDGKFKYFRNWNKYGEDFPKYLQGDHSKNGPNDLEGTAEFSITARKKIINEYKGLKDALNEKRDKIINDPTYQGKAMLASGKAVFDLMVSEQDGVKEYEQALRDMYNIWYRRGLSNAEVEKLQAHDADSTIWDKCKNMSHVNYLCLKEYYLTKSYNDRQCADKSWWEYRRVKHCYKRKFKFFDNVWYSPPDFPDYLKIFPLNKVTNQSYFKGMDMWIPNLKVLGSQFDNGLSYDALDNWGGVWEEGLSDRKMKWSSRDAGKKFYDYHESSVKTFLSKYYSLTDEYVDYELGIQKKCLETANENLPECELTKLMVRNLSYVVYAMNRAWGWNNTMDLQRRVFKNGGGGHRVPLFELVEQAYHYSSSYLDNISQIRQDRIDCLNQMADSQFEQFKNSENRFKPGNYQDDPTASQQASRQAQNRDLQLKSYSTTQFNSPNALLNGLGSNGIGGNGTSISGKVFGTSLGFESSGSADAQSAFLKKLADKEAAKNPGLQKNYIEKIKGETLASVGSAQRSSLSSLTSSSLSGNTSNSLLNSNTNGNAAKLSDDENDPNKKKNLANLNPNIGNGSSYRNGSNNSNYGNSSYFSSSGGGGSDYDESGNGTNGNSNSSLNESEKESILANLKKSNYKSNDDDTLFDRVSKNYFLYAYPRLLSKKEVEKNSLDEEKPSEIKDNDLKNSLLNGLDKYK